MAVFRHLGIKIAKSGKLICGALAFLGVLGAILGIAAESKRIRSDQVERRINGYCLYPESPALMLGIMAAVVTLLAQILSNVAGGCICCTTRSTGSFSVTSARSIAIIALCMSWTTFLLAFVLLLAGASLNQGHDDDHWFNGQCFVVRPGVFAGGAVLSLATAIFGILYYIAATEARRQDYVEDGIRMGQQMGTPYQSYAPYPNAAQFPVMESSYYPSAR